MSSAAIDLHHHLDSSPTHTPMVLGASAHRQRNTATHLLASRLGRARRDAGWGTLALARYLGMPHGAVIDAEQGHHRPGRLWLLGWAIATDVPLEHFTALT